MNYIIENNNDFFNALKEEIKEDESYKDKDKDKEEECLISKEPLTIHHITLPCNHKFNYIPLYNTIIIQKQQQYNKGYSFEINPVSSTKIRCPYCRTLHLGILPYIPLKDVMPITYVNTPIKFVMDYKFCSWKLINGKNKDNFCNKNAYYNPNDNHTVNSLSSQELNNLPVFCPNHWAKYNKKNDNKKNDNKKIILSEEMIELSKKHTIISLKKLLKDNNLKQSGNKDTLIKRFIDYINQ
jgi:hypothetical protein